MKDDNIYIEVAFGLGADKTFTYSLPEHLRARAVPGQRVSVPFGSRVKAGIIVGISDKKGDFDARDALDIPDEQPLIPPSLLELTRWVAGYYRSPWGMVLGAALPPGIDEGKVARPRRGVEEDHPGSPFPEKKLSPNAAQEAALGKLAPLVKEGLFGAFLLHGATGSGKTEVYLRAIEAVPEGRGAVVLVPEISLTPQLVRRFRDRFGKGVAVLHSGLTDSQRRSEWRRIRSGEATVAVGARSAVFAPFDRPGIIIVDEEHDGSYKQEEGVRYNARDVAVMRAKLAGCPVVLGSATPSLESYFNALEGKYELLELPERVEGRPMPGVTLIDLKDYPGLTPLTPPLVEAAKKRLGRGEQALFFLNRRGYSDFLICRDCGHVPQCPSCSISLTYHKRDGVLLCHWCGIDQKPGATCEKCGGDKIKYMGGGTERLEKEIEGLFVDVKITRMDRDTVRERGAHARLLDEVASGASGILLGTQMVAKGHDLP
ncbi:MAG TPA: primosomal protein N', partial [Nitrospirota bacterium]